MTKNLSDYTRNKRIFVLSRRRKKEKKKHYRSSKINKVTYNKAFWKAINPFLSDKGTHINKITLLDNNKVISDDKQLCKTFSTFFREVVNTVGVSDSFNISNYSHSNPVYNVIRNYKNHSSVKKIR